MSINKTVKVVQFLPYFPPHKGGLETVAEEWGKWYVKAGCGNVLNATFSVGQEEGVLEYERDGYRVVVIPAFDLISNFPVPKFWTKGFWGALRIVREFDPDVVQTHTRFFLSSFLGGVCAKAWKKRWSHVEHGSDYVRLSARWKNALAYLYDRLFGKWVVVSADFVVPISKACDDFVRKEFKDRTTHIIYRGIDAPVPESPSSVPGVPEGKGIIGFLGRLVAWKNVHGLISAYRILPAETRAKYALVIVGDGEEFQRLKGMDSSGDVVFTGAVPFSQALGIQSKFDIHVHPPMPGGGLATTLIQAMQMGKPIVATRNEGATDVIADGVNGILVAEPTPEALAEGIMRILESRGQWPDFARENQRIVAEKFDWSKNILEYRELFASSLSRLRVAFVPPVGNGGPLSLYRSIVEGFFEDRELDCRIERGIATWFRLHFFCDYDIVVSTIPFLWKPRCRTFILNVHGDYRKERSFKTPGSMLAYWYPLSLRIADKVVFPSEFLAKTLGIDLRGKYSVIPNFSLFSSETANLGQTKNPSEGRKTIVTVTKFDFLEKSRGVLEIIPALVRLSMPITFRIIGGGRYWESVREEVSRMDIPDFIKIEWTGAIPHAAVVEKVSACDVFVYASRLDTFSISTLEALLLQRPVVINDYGPFPELFPSVCVPMEGWTERISKILSDSDFSKKVIADGKADAEKFSSRNALPKWKNLFKT